MNGSDEDRGKPWDGYTQDTEDREYGEVLRNATRALQGAGARLANAIEGANLRKFETCHRMPEPGARKPEWGWQ